MVILKSVDYYRIRSDINPIIVGILYIPLHTHCQKVITVAVNVGRNGWYVYQQFLLSRLFLLHSYIRRVSCR